MVKHLILALCLLLVGCEQKQEDSPAARSLWHLVNTGHTVEAYQGWPKLVRADTLFDGPEVRRWNGKSWEVDEKETEALKTLRDERASHKDEYSVKFDCQNCGRDFDHWISKGTPVPEKAKCRWCEVEAASPTTE